MTTRALVGLVLINASYLGLGWCALWAIGGLRRRGDIVRLAGLSYLLGVGIFGIVWTMLLVAGVPFTGWTLLVSLGVLAGGFLAGGFLALGTALRRSWPTAAVRRPLEWSAIASAVGTLLAAVFFVFLFRSGRLQGLYAFDAWAFWVPKAKAIYEFQGLDEQLFTTLDGPTYPPLVPIIDAAAFHAMGSADVVTLHLQYWLLAIGFVSAVVGLLALHVRSWILWPFVLLTLVVPRTSEHLLVPQADFVLQYLFGTAVVLAALWIVDREDWNLVAAALLLAAALLTKREGTLLTVCLVVGLFAVTVDRLRRDWLRLGLVTSALILVSIPWRAWYREHGIGGEAPGDVTIADRLSKALRLSVEVLLDTSLFSALVPLALVAIVVAATWGDRRLALLFGLVSGLLVAGGAWIVAAYPELPFTADEAVNPIVRYTVACVLVLGIGAPLLLSTVWRVGVAERR